MIPNISISCDAVFGAGSENFGTVIGNVTFQDGSANSGTVTGNAVFEGASENKAGASVTGNATFSILAMNNGTVSGTITEPDLAISPGEGQSSYWQLVMSSGISIQQYQGGGYYNGRYAAYGLPFITLADAEAFVAWITANVGVNQYQPNGQWAFNGSTVASQEAGEEAAYQAWLAANTGVNQYNATGSHNGQWASNSTEYASQAEAQAAYDTFLENSFLSWLQNNSFISQYTGLFSAKSGKWFWGNDPTEYNSEADAQAAYDAANPQ